MAHPDASPVPGQALDYADGTTPLEGYLVHPGGAGARPGVLVVPQWMGVTDHERGICRELAGLGFVALAADIFGKGVRPAGPQEAAQFAGQYKGDRPLYRRRLAAGLAALKGQPGVDAARLGVIGYCFGGTGALEAARAGLPVRGVVSFHGGLDAPVEALPSPIRAKVLVCHGADDPFVPAADVAAFHEEMRRAGADYVFIAYAGAVHAFTQLSAGNDPARGVAYQEAAARRSWRHMRDFFEEIL